MQSKTLSQPALDVINSYIHLPFKNKDVSCPYFNNRRIKIRAALRVLVGKGSAEDIVEEATLISFREKIDLEKLNSGELKKFLIDNNLGIDCSSLAYYVLNAESHGKLKHQIKFPYIKNPLRKLLSRLRTVENVGVKTLAHEKNSKKISLENIKPGDIIIMLDVGTSRDHVLIVHQVDFENNTPHTIHYTHALNWSADGKYNHGVRQGKIEIIDIKKPLTEQRWIENGKEEITNETFIKAREAKQFLIKRLSCVF